MLGKIALAVILSASPATSQVPVPRVMPLGDSITESLTGYASYRYYLWKALEAGGYCADFVGTRRGVRAGPPLYSDFDQDHQGVSGIRADEAALWVRGWAASTLPDIVLIHLGTNDLWQGQSAVSTINDLGLVIDELRAANANVQIVLAQIIPASPSQGFDVTALNLEIPLLAAAKSLPSSPVVVADLATGFDPALLTYDGVHPNDDGERWMADHWLAPLTAWLGVCASSYGPLGPGCPGTQGVPTLAAKGAQLPLLGTSFTVEIGNLPPAAPLTAFIGFHIDLWGATPLPFDLGRIGMPGCKMYSDPGFHFPLVNQGGMATWTLSIPVESGLVGLPFYQQAFVGDPGVNMLGLIVSDANQGVMGTR